MLGSVYLKKLSTSLSKNTVIRLDNQIALSNTNQTKHFLITKDGPQYQNLKKRIH